MGKKKSAVVGRAWHLLRLALLWARKGGAFKQKLLFNLPGYLKALRPAHHPDRLHYGQREFSFDETPVFHFKMHRPASMRHLRLPCINAPPVDFDNDDCGHIFFKPEQETCTFETEGGEGYEDYSTDGDEGNGLERGDLCELEEGGGIDLKAEKFIAKFYEQMKLQRQVSYLEYNEMLERGMS